MLTTLTHFKVVRQSVHGLDSLAPDLQCFHEHFVNIKIESSEPLSLLHSVPCGVGATKARIQRPGPRVLRRFSGTEPLARVIVKNKDDRFRKHFSRSRLCRGPF